MKSTLAFIAIMAGILTCSFLAYECGQINHQCSLPVEVAKTPVTETEVSTSSGPIVYGNGAAIVASPVRATVRASWERGFKSGLMCADEMLSDIIKGVDSLGLGVALHDCKSRKWNELVAEMKGEK
jgi:hypothetical protein